MSEPGSFHKLMRKIEDIKESRIKEIKKRLRFSDNLEEQIKIRKEELMKAKGSN